MRRLPKKAAECATKCNRKGNVREVIIQEATENAIPPKEYENKGITRYDNCLRHTEVKKKRTAYKIL